MDPQIDIEKLRISTGRGTNTYKLEELRSFAKHYGIPLSNSGKAQLVKELLNVLRAGRAVKPAAVVRTPSPKKTAAQTPAPARKTLAPARTPAPAALAAARLEAINFEKLRDSVGRTGYTVNQLKAYARAYGVSPQGIKAELVQRLLEKVYERIPRLKPQDEDDEDEGEEPVAVTVILTNEIPFEEALYDMLKVASRYGDINQKDYNTGGENPEVTLWYATREQAQNAVNGLGNNYEVNFDE